MTWRAKNTASSPSTRVERMTPVGVKLSDVLTPVHKKTSWLRKLWNWFWGRGLHR
jgi:hypothetical protein